MDALISYENSPNSTPVKSGKHQTFIKIGAANKKENSTPKQESDPLFLNGLENVELTPVQTRKRDRSGLSLSKRENREKNTESPLKKRHKTRDVLKKVLSRTVSLASKPLHKRTDSFKTKTIRKSRLDDSEEFDTKSLKHSLSFATLPTRHRKAKEYAKPVKDALPFRSIILNDGEWIVEKGSNKAKVFGFSSYSSSDSDDDRWYTKEFLGNFHQNFMAVDRLSNPVSISIMVQGGQSKSIVRTVHGNTQQCRPFFGGCDIKKMVKNLRPELKLKNIREVTSEKHPEELALFQSTDIQTTLKFGILYCRKGQMSEEEMFSNTKMSKKFEQFLDFLGDRVELKGYDKYCGGLDTKVNATGTHSVSTTWNGYDIMFHVSTLLPHQNDCEQQIERKRHIGNDVVVIVFQDGKDEDYHPATITTQFQHILAVVQRESNSRGVPKYRFQVARKNTVPEFEPELPEVPIFESDESFRNFFFSKLVNGEKAAMKAPTFKTKTQRARVGLLKYYDSVY